MKTKLSKSVYTKLTIELLLCITLLFIIIAVLFITNEKYNNANLYNLNTNISNVLTNSISHNIKLTEQVSQTLLSGRELIDFISSPYEPNTGYSHYTNSIRNYLIATVNTDYRSDIRLYTINPTIPMGMGVIYPLAKISDNTTIQSFINSSLTSTWYSNEDFEAEYNPYFFPTENSFIYIERVTSPTGVFLGLIVCSIPEKYFFSESTSENATIIPIGHNRIINYTKTSFSDEDILQIESLADGFSDYKNILIYKQSFDLFPFHIFIATPKDTSHYAVSIVLLFMILFFIFLGAFFFNHLRKVFHKINACINSMDQSISNNFVGRLEESGEDELSQIARRINALLEKISLLLRITIKKETAHKEAQLVALQHQINPHFIYNTMEVFSSKMKIYKHYEESDALVAFANIFRYNITNRGDLVPISDELAQAENYINIQRLRYPLITLHTHAPHSMLTVKMLKFILQPIIENSILHGIDDKRIPLAITISLTVQDNQPHIIIFTIKDNGVGISPDLLEKMNDSFLTQTPESTLHSPAHSLGLHNINSRLKLQYGEDSYLSIDSKKGQGTTISFPITVS